MKKKSILLLLFVLLALCTYSQGRRKIWGGIEIGSGISLSDNGDYYRVSYGEEYRMSLSSLKAVLGYYVTPDLSVGAAIGLQGYSMPGVNTLPVWIDARYHPFINKKVQVHSSLGYAIAISESALTNGFLADVAVGYKLFTLKKVSFIPAIGYDFCNYAIEKNGKFSQSRHSLFLKVGIVY